MMPENSRKFSLSFASLTHSLDRYNNSQVIFPQKFPLLIYPGHIFVYELKLIHTRFTLGSCAHRRQSCPRNFAPPVQSRLLPRSCALAPGRRPSGTSPGCRLPFAPRSAPAGSCASSCRAPSAREVPRSNPEKKAFENIFAVARSFVFRYLYRNCIQGSKMRLKIPKE